ncbi:MAG: ABC transporter ATP-binding protein [Deltaproteobacteria bacterium]|nr:ABC transporter ATP-binding protein [Deltaproteobacteria bacterium]
MNNSKDLPLLRVENLTKHFRIERGFPKSVTYTVKAVDDVSFTINKQEAFGLAGESGCGKSTVGRCVLRLIEPNSGRVSLGEMNVLALGKNDLRIMRKKMQIIFQDPYSSLNPRRTIGQTLEEPMHVHKLYPKNDIRKVAEGLLESVGLSPGAIDKYPHEFSGGQRQRIGIARALLFNPELIVADEAVSALDVSIQMQILQILKDLKEKLSLSYLFISHDLAVVRYFCQRVAIMYLGKFVELGTVKQIFDDPLHPYTLTLRNASPIPDPIVKQEFAELKGEVPSPISPPSGCHFHPRCPKAMDICPKEYPAWTEQGQSRGVACHLYT